MTRRIVTLSHLADHLADAAAKAAAIEQVTREAVERAQAANLPTQTETTPEAGTSIE